MSELKCRVPMWMMGFPAGFCDKPAYGDQLPFEVLRHDQACRYWNRTDAPYCVGPCCPDHGGPRADEIRIFHDGYSERGQRLWCAVMPDFQNLQESPAAFSVNPLAARAELKRLVSAGGPTHD